MQKTVPLAAFALALSGCTTMGEGMVEDDQVASITFATTPCYGTCPAFEVRVDADGNGVFVGERDVAVVGTRPFTATAAQWQAFAARLRPFRPAADTAYDMGNCSVPAATDSPTVAITWTDRSGDDTTLQWYLGCAEPRLASDRDRIYQAWRELPIGSFVDRSPDP